ncbi:MAG TPA: glycosyltransferase [Pyrinomonadaceae bacterium]|nr:glycosyltransferase [Pyrinomonadaceae bacterium]
MKILRIIARLNVGGPARHVVWLTDKLRPLGYETTLIAGTVPEGEEDMAYFADEHSVTPVYIKEMSRELSPKDIVSLFKIFWTMLRERPDVVHTHTAKAGTVGRVAAFAYRWLTLGTIIGRPRKVRIVHTFHGHVFHSYYGSTKTRVFLAIERILAAIATDKIIVITEQQLDEINGRFRVGRREQFAVVPLGMELERFAATPEKARSARKVFSAADDELVVGFSGRMTEIKDIPLLLRAAKIALENSEAIKFRFVLIGDGALRPELEALANEHGIAERVVFLGNRSDIHELLPGFDIFVLTSKNEGTPLSMIEAMAAGVPAVSTNVGGVADLLGNAVESQPFHRLCSRGIAVDSREASDLARGLIYLAKSNEIRERVKIEAREFVRERYSIDRLVSDVDGLYRSVCSKT